MKKVILTKGKYTIVDDEDYSFLTNGNFKWRFSTTGYAEDIKKRRGRVNYTLMHRLINQTPRDMETDHINGDKLDNRKENLRTVNAFENQWNREGIRGIYFNKSSNKWIARIMVNRKRIHIGSFERKEEAFSTYKKHVVETYTEYGKRRLQKISI